MDELQAFLRNRDGTWTCIRPVTLYGPNGRIQVTAGSTFALGTHFMNVDLAEWLEQQAMPARAQNPTDRYKVGPE